MSGISSILSELPDSSQSLLVFFNKVEQSQKAFENLPKEDTFAKLQGSILDLLNLIEQKPNEAIKYFDRVMSLCTFVGLWNENSIVKGRFLSIHSRIQSWLNQNVQHMSAGEKCKSGGDGR